MNKGTVLLRDPSKSGAYCRSGKYVRDEIPNWTRCGDCGARVLPGTPDMHDGDCHVRASLLSFGLGAK